MTLRYLLDTGIVSSPASKIPNPQIVKRLESHGHECAIAAPVWHELTFGFEIAGEKPSKTAGKSACLTTP